jgi:tetratricopeptide (TPR) repeat protein
MIWRDNLSDERKMFLAVAIGCLLLVAAVVFAYWPGLRGPFMLDDHGSIAALGNYGGVVDWQTLKSFVLGGNAGPTGRPLSLLTFLIDATDWPADPAPFKRTNLIIHLLTGAMLGVLTKQILSLLQFSKTDAFRLALASAAVWLLHPFLVSTTLYAVQRMAQLTTLFMLAGLVLYLRVRVSQSALTKADYIKMSVLLPLFTVLALLCKENGILLPMLVGVVELTVIASQRERIAPLHRVWVALFIGFPTLVISLYLGKQFFRPDFFDIVAPRDFSLYERLLTEARVVADYLQNWFIPKLYTTGVFQDHIIKSTGVLSPPTTLLAILFHLVVIALAFVYRRKQPLFALAALFFYTGHLIESTVLNLELYFEHRNYLSASFLFLPVFAALYKHARPKLFATVAVALLLVLCGFTRYSATVWESVPSIVEASAHKAPTSARAQARYANLLFNANMHERSLQVIEEAIRNIPHNDSLLQVNRLIILCNTDSLAPEEVQKAADKLSQIPFDPRLLKAYNEFAKGLAQGRCPNIPVRSLLPMFTDMLKVPENAATDTLAHSHIKFMIGYINVYSGEPRQALRAFEESLQAQPGASHAMAMAALMASSGYSEQALYLSDVAMNFLRDEQETMMIGTRVVEADILEFQETVRRDAKALHEPDTVDVAP